MPLRLRSNRPLPRKEIVTGERLLGLADIVIVPRSTYEFHRNLDNYARETVIYSDPGELDDAVLARISARASIFVYTHALADFIEYVWPRLGGTGYVLITHNSDVEIGASYFPWLDGAGAKLRGWFAQNVTASHEKLVPLPIGVANSMWEHGNLRTLYRVSRRWWGKERPELVYLNFNRGTHPSRERAWQALRANFPAAPEAPPEPKRFGAYLSDVARHRFCPCPRGNGIDTHRFWECQYLGVVPIVERSFHTEYWSRCRLPVVIVDDWTEVTAEMLETANTNVDTPAAHEHLRLSHYERLVRAGETGEADRAPTP